MKLPLSSRTAAVFAAEGGGRGKKLKDCPETGYSPSGNLVDGDLVGDAAQSTALRYRLQPIYLEQCRSLRVGDDRSRRQDRARIGKSLDARGNVHRGAEIILPVIEHHRKARPLMDANLEQEVIATASIIELVHRIAHAQRGGDRPVGGRERCHDR